VAADEAKDGYVPLWLPLPGWRLHGA
jgi:hypothetical protein